ncbi:MAG: hypothetical protein GXP24_12625 [Planctomycetes bacterium]|nr:hypothetical protein [Planctomycetota bacterium]
MTAVAEKVAAPADVAPAVAAPTDVANPEASASHGTPVCRCRQPHDLEQMRRDGAQIGDRVSIHPAAIIDHPEKLILGDDVQIGPGVCLNCAGGIEIGARTILEAGALILSTTPRIPTDGSRIAENGVRNELVRISEDVLLGAGSVLKPGDYIGKGAILGPNCVVRFGLQEYKVVAVAEPLHKGNRMGAMYAE